MTTIKQYPNCEAFIYQGSIETVMAKRFGISVIALLFCIVLIQNVLATIEVIPVDDDVLFGERATYTLRITNDDSTARTFTIKSLETGILWDVKTRPIRDSTVTIAAGGTRDVTMSAEPVEKFPPGVYLMDIEIASDKKVEQAQLKVFMGPTTAKGYLASLRVKVDMNDRIDPRDTQSVKVTVENLNPLDLSDLVLQTISEIQGFDRQEPVSLAPGPGTSKTVEFSFKMPDSQQPKTYSVFFQFKKDDEIVKIVDKTVEVLPITDAFTVNIEEKEQFLKTTQILHVKNQGNVGNTQIVKHPAPFFKRLVTSTEPKAQIIKEDRRYYGWELELDPDEQVDLMVITSYRTLALILLLLIGGTAAYYLYRAPVTLQKTASNVRMDEGSMSGLKVTLIVKNLSSQTLKEVEIKDEIPGIADVEQNVEMGSLKPHQIVRGNHGSRIVKWKFSELEGHEERLITYQIKSKLNIIGTLHLPRAKAIVTMKSGSKRSSYSNSFRVTTGE